jgi:hypothetical protein
MRSARVDSWFVVLIGLAVMNLGNGAWMLADPAGWYHNLPAAVPHTGPLNEHFVRDIGSVFVMMGVALAWAALSPPARLPLVAMVALFDVLHALVHVADTVRGRLPAAHWAIDFPGVYLPALFAVGLTGLLVRRRPDAAF